MQPADLGIFDRHQILQLVADIRGKAHASEDWVLELRGNLLNEHAIPEAPYFLLALPDAFYLWTPATSRDSQAPPDYRIDARQELTPYIQGWRDSLEGLNPYILQILVRSWLQDLTFRQKNGSSEPWLYDSGLFEAIQEGRVEVDAVVSGSAATSR
jgi:hypothetical protein